MNKQKTNFKKTHLMDVSRIGAFTLVELIVVITILAILGTIAFISLSGYSADARDSSRISDISSIKSSLELYQLDAGKYPNPTDGVNILYSGSVVWNQGTFGETVFTNTDKLNKIPTDPLSDKEYTYSVINTKNEYEIGGMIEGDEISMNNEQGIMNNVASSPLTRGELRGISAGTTESTAYTSGNYNGQMSKTLSGNLCTVLSLPGIITNDTSVTDLQQIITQKKLVYRGFNNLPSSFKTSKFKYDGGFDFTPNKLASYSDTGSCASLIDKTDYSKRVQLLKGLQDSYSGTIVNNVGEIKNILSLVIDENNPSQEVVKYAGNFVNNNLGGELIMDNILIISNIETATGWLSIDGNCDIPDLYIGTQVWAGCNSTIGLGVEWGKKSDGTDGTIDTCYPNYDNTINNTSSCTIGLTIMSSNTKANTWFSTTNSNGDTEFDSIWGKFYTFSNISTACPTGRHVPSDLEWTYLENYLNLSTCRNNEGWQCYGLGWNNNGVNTRKLVSALKIPLSGYQSFSGPSFVHRGIMTYLWSSTSYDGTYAYGRSFLYNNSGIDRQAWRKTHGFNVRCIKDN